MFVTGRQSRARLFIKVCNCDAVDTYQRVCDNACLGVKLREAGWIAWPLDEGRGEMLTVVILLAFLSMSEALLRQGYLLVPEKAETADPAHAPRLFSCWLIMCVRVLATCCVCEWVDVKWISVLHIYVYVMRFVCVCDRLAWARSNGGAAPSCPDTSPWRRSLSEPRLLWR